MRLVMLGNLAWERGPGGTRPSVGAPGPDAYAPFRLGADDGHFRVWDFEATRAFRLTVANDSDVLVQRWAVSFNLPAGAHAYGEGTEFDIHPETSRTRGLPSLFEVDCLGDAYWCSATWLLPPGGQAAIMVTVHGENPLEPSGGPQGFRVFA